MIGQLEELFSEWKEKHKSDIFYEFDTPCINGHLIPRENFISDGFCASNNCEEHSILYISKESHEYKNNSNLNEIKIHEYTWIKHCIEKNKNGIFFRRLKMMQEELNEDIDKISFMNINKRGGGNYTDMVTLNTYALNFSNYILKEIEIINPKLIICCGLGLKRLLKMIYKKSKKELNIKIIEVHHPSYVISDKKYINEFRQQLIKNNII